MNEAGKTLLKQIFATFIEIPIDVGSTCEIFRGQNRKSAKTRYSKFNYDLIVISIETLDTFLYK